MIRFFRVLFNLLRTYHWENGSTWSDEDALRLKQTLASDFGIRLVARLRNASIMLNANAVQEGSPWKCGQASGYMLALADISTLSACGELESSQSEDSSEGELESLAHLSP